MVGIDASIALAIWFPNVACSVPNGKERVEYLLELLELRNERILLPTPALSEILVRAGEAGVEFVNQIGRSSRFEALAIAAAKKAGGKAAGNATESWAKIKFDHQIVAICKIKRVRILYSDDPGLCNFASHSDLRTVRLADLPLRPEERGLFAGLENPTVHIGGNEETKQLTAESESSDPALD